MTQIHACEKLMTIKFSSGTLLIEESTRATSKQRLIVYQLILYVSITLHTLFIFCAIYVKIFS